MKKTVKIAACQVPDLRQDIAGALSQIESYAEKAKAQQVDLLCFPEGFLQGYEKRDEQVARGHALDLSGAEFTRILQRLTPIAPMLVFGLTELEGDALFNTAVVVEGGQLLGRYRKTQLLKGERIFTPGSEYPIFTVAGLQFGINICYDTASPTAAAAVAARGAQLIVCPANNMTNHESAEKNKARHNEARGQRAAETGLWLVSSDVAGERDDLICYGPTALINPQGQVVAQLPLLETGMLVEEIPV